MNKKHLSLAVFLVSAQTRFSINELTYYNKLVSGIKLSGLYSCIRLHRLLVKVKVIAK